MEIPHTMTTLSEAMNIMKEKGYKINFEMNERGFIRQDTEDVFAADDLLIKKIFRFEGESDPGDMSALYVIETKTGDKGLLVDAYGTYAGQGMNGLADFLKKIPVEEDH